LLGTKAILALILFVILAVIVTSISPIYDFKAPEPFSGPDVFNPYSTLDTTHCWKRANFHTHTKVDGLFSECEHTPAEVYSALEKFGYEIITFSNHNALTTHPFDTALQVNVYEHGYNLLKFHKLVFGSKDVNHFDHLLPLLASQKQFQINLLKKDCDLIQFNHPTRTTALTRDELEKIGGYELIELDSGRSTENEYWDWALSAGRYSFGVANDDLHYPDKSNLIGVRCNFLNTPSGRYQDLKRTLESGCFYSMRVPDYGNGDWEYKYSRHKDLPQIESIGLQESTVYMQVSQIADSIKVFGQDHTVLKKVTACDNVDYKIANTDSYARLVAYFPEGEVIYTNAFARYDAAESDTPFRGDLYKVNLLLTILYNILLLFIISIVVYKVIRLFR
jgi:hypothetical protein